MGLEKFNLTTEFRILVEEIHAGLKPAKVKNALKVAEATRFLLQGEKLVNEDGEFQSVHTEVIVIGALLHNCGADRNAIKKDFGKIFENRKLIEKTLVAIKAKEDMVNYNIPQQFLEPIFMAIESQLGKSTPVSSLIPNSGHLGFYVSIACNLVYGGKWKND